MSGVAKTVGRIVDSELAPFLRHIGFMKKGLNFHKTDANSIAVVNVQGSWGSLGDAGKFTVNLGRYFPAVADLAGDEPLDRLPKEYECQVRSRIGKLMPSGTDHWWSVLPETDIARLAAELKAAVESHGLPWLLRVAALEGLKRELGGFPSIEAASVSLLLGNRAEAATCIAEFIRERPAAQARAVAWARSQGLDPS
jgi:hypothetical protein